MRLNKFILLFFCILSLIFSLEEFSFAKPGIKITQPQDGLVVTPGQEITVTVEAVEGFEIKWLRVGVASFHKEKITSLPATVTVSIPLEVAGKISILAFGVGVSDPYVSDSISLNVQQTATLQSLKLDREEWRFVLDWNGNIKSYDPYMMGTVYGIYSDGIERDITKNAGTTYVSSDPSIVSLDIDNKGRVKVQAHKAGETSIVVSNSGVSTVIPIFFEQPTGIRPSETIPPTTTIDIHPPANSAGWHNQDITITLTAKDDSGIQEVDWRFAGRAKEDYVNSDLAVVTYNQEGVKNFSYWSRDKEGNEDDNKVTLRLDKTPPAITPAISLQPNQAGWNNSDLIVSFTATDSLSGVKSVTPPVAVSTEGANQAVTGEAIDLADNKSTASVNLNIDKTPPQLILHLKPLSLSENHRKDKDKKSKDKQKDEKGNWHELTYSATDILSGLKTLQAGLIILPISGYQIELEQDKELNIRIDEKKKALKIEASDPQEVLKQLQNGLLNLKNNRILQLKLKQGEAKWKIEQKEKGLEIQTPSLIFKAEAADLADNKSTKELEFKKK